MKDFDKEFKNTLLFMKRRKYFYVIGFSIFLVFAVTSFIKFNKETNAYYEANLKKYPHVDMKEELRGKVQSAVCDKGFPLVILR